MVTLIIFNSRCDSWWSQIRCPFNGNSLVPYCIWYRIFEIGLYINKRVQKLLFFYWRHKRSGHIFKQEPVGSLYIYTYTFFSIGNGCWNILVIIPNMTALLSAAFFSIVVECIVHNRVLDCGRGAWRLFSSTFIMQFLFEI